MEHGYPKNTCVITGTPGSGCYRVVRNGRDSGHLFTRYSDASEFCKLPVMPTPMTDRETLDKAKALFTGATQGDLLAREVIEIAERLIASEEARVAFRVNEMLARTEELQRSIAKCKP